jgi:hypothetical protein
MDMLSSGFYKLHQKAKLGGAEHRAYSEHSWFPGKRACEQGSFFGDGGEFAQRNQLKTSTVLSLGDEHGYTRI